MKTVLVFIALVALPSCLGFSIRSAQLSNGCNITLTSPVGNVTSPGYPGNYPNNRNCEYRIRPGLGNRIVITFVQFSLENNYDYLRIIDGSRTTSYTGDIRPNPYTSNTTSVDIRFESDHSVQRAGFVLTYQIVGSPTCDKNLTIATGVVTSPGYPRKYRNEMSCTTRIAVQPGKRIQLNFMNFSLEAHSSCGYDNLQIIDGSNVTTFCGQSIPPQLISKSNTITLKFKSDSSVRDDGYAARYKTVEAPTCNKNLTAATGTVSSPGFPNKYPNIKKCTTHIRVIPGKRVQLNFKKFSLEAHSQCSYDYLQIIDGSYMKKFCGQKVPSQYISNGNSVTLLFESDSSINDDGYMAEYKTVDPPKPTPPPIPDTVNDANCGISKVSQSRVIGGQNATKGAWPWQIGMFSKYDSFFCGGSIISPHWIVTAAHCVSGEIPGNIVIKAGDWDLNHDDGTEQRREVQKIIMHPKYNLNGKINYDIALLKLKTPVLFNNYVNTVCIPGKSNPVAVGTNCYITGWGKIKHPGNSHPILQQAVLPVVDTNVCQVKLDKMNWGMNITNVMVCGGKEGSIKSGCHGDSGGPFVCKDSGTNKFVLHGAVSWGSGRCSTDDVFTVFARVQALRQWIDEQMSRN